MVVGKFAAVQKGGRSQCTAELGIEVTTLLRKQEQTMEGTQTQRESGSYLNERRSVKKVDDLICGGWHCSYYTNFG